jgi:type IV pilus assembly protein PilC
MIAVGEETGKLDKMLKKISIFYDTYLEYSVRKMTRAIEPLFLVVMGCMIGLIMLSLIIPIFDMVKILRH